MNYLAHLSLSSADADSLTGNLMGDFMHGVKLETLPLAIQQGVAHHRAVDRFTDQYEPVLALKPLFAKRYRRFAGVMLDVSFDYFLTKHWARYYAIDLKVFNQHCYDALLSRLALMPERMQQTVQLMVREDWLSGYEDFERVGFALDRIAARIRFRNEFQGGGREVEQHYEAVEAAFLQLYPALMQLE